MSCTLGHFFLQKGIRFASTQIVSSKIIAPFGLLCSNHLVPAVRRRAAGNAQVSAMHSLRHTTCMRVEARVFAFDSKPLSSCPGVNSQHTVSDAAPVLVARVAQTKR